MQNETILSQETKTVYIEYRITRNQKSLKCNDYIFGKVTTKICPTKNEGSCMKINECKLEWW